MLYYYNRLTQIELFSKYLILKKCMHIDMIAGNMKVKIKRVHLNYIETYIEEMNWILSLANHLCNRLYLDSILQLSDRRSPLWFSFLINSGIHSVADCDN